MTQPDTTTYQQLRRAREHLRAGEWAQARGILRRLDHPQAQALLDTSTRSTRRRGASRCLGLLA